MFHAKPRSRVPVARSRLKTWSIPSFAVSGRNSPAHNSHIASKGGGRGQGDLGCHDRLVVTAMPSAAERPRSSSTVSICDQPSAVRRSRLAYCRALLSLCRAWWAEDCRHRGPPCARGGAAGSGHGPPPAAADRERPRARISCTIRPVSAERRSSGKVRLTPASAPRRCGKQIEPCRPGSMVVMHIALALHNDLPILITRGRL
jgi:hypothetical protein